MNQRKFSKLEFAMEVLVLLLNVVGLVLFGVSYTTGYYTFGEMNSPMILSFFLVGIGMEIFSMIAMAKWGGKMWTRFLTFAVTALLVAGASETALLQITIPVTAARKPSIIHWQRQEPCFWE